MPADILPIDRRTAFVVHSWKHVAAVLQAARDARQAVWLVTPVGASYSFGAGFWAAIEARRRELYPAVDARLAVDCDDAPGHVLACLRAGLRWLVFAGNAAARARLVDIAMQQDAALIARPADALDLLDCRDADLSETVASRLRTAMPAQGEA
jgi:hypothetical protein